MQYNLVMYIAGHCSIEQCSAVQCSAVQYTPRIFVCNVVARRMFHPPVTKQKLHPIKLPCAVLHSPVLNLVVVYCTVLHCIAHYTIFKSDLHGLNCSSTSHFASGTKIKRLKRNFPLFF